MWNLLGLQTRWLMSFFALHFKNSRWSIHLSGFSMDLRQSTFNVPPDVGQWASENGCPIKQQPIFESKIQGRNRKSVPPVERSGGPLDWSVKLISSLLFDSLQRRFIVPPFKLNPRLAYISPNKVVVDELADIQWTLLSSKHGNIFLIATFAPESSLSPNSPCIEWWRNSILNGVHRLSKSPKSGHRFMVWWFSRNDWITLLIVEDVGMRVANRS